MPGPKGDLGESTILFSPGRYPYFTLGIILIAQTQALQGRFSSSNGFMVEGQGVAKQGDTWRSRRSATGFIEVVERIFDGISCISGQATYNRFDVVVGYLDPPGPRLY